MLLQPHRDDQLALALATIDRARRAIAVRRKRRARRALAADKLVQQLVAAMIAARTRAGLTQESVAQMMGTTTSAISRLESGRCTRPTLGTLQKYAQAVECVLEIRLRSPR